MGMEYVAGDPCWRGEHEHLKKGDDESPGLSPLARGTLCFRSLN